MKCWNSPFNAQGLVWNVETHHLMHKVRGYYNSCTCRNNENICNSSGGAQEKGKTGSKPDETLFGTKSAAFLSLTTL